MIQTLIRSACACATALCALPLAAGAAVATPVLPTAAQVTAGAATVRSSGASMTITQSTPDVAINWRSFSIGAGDSLRFIQPGASSIALNRVLGQDPSQILGMLSANGQVFILNPNGVLFGPHAQVTVGGIVASTLGVSDLDLSAGRLTLSADAASGGVNNQGAIVTASGGYVALIAPQVRNEGSIHAPAGNVALVAASDVTLTLGSGSLFGVAVAPATLNALIDSRSAHRTDGARIVLSAAAMDQVARAAVNSRGLVEAGALATRDGVIRLQASEVINSGGIDVSSGRGDDASRGGQVAISGDRVALTSTSMIDASGATGGGLIQIGGGLHGAGALPHASVVTIAPGAQLLADATGQGNGGTIAVWSDGSSQVAGTLQAIGGARGGSGGMIETSGHVLDVNGIAVDASAVHGAAGSWLLDPYNLTVTTAATTATETTASGPTDTWTSGTGATNVQNTTISAALTAGTSVVLQTSGTLADGTGNGDITVSNLISKTGGGAATLSLQAAGSILINAAIASNSGALNVTLDANLVGGRGAVVISAPITTFGGALDIGPAVGTASYANGVKIGAALSTAGGAITMNGTGFNGGAGDGVLINNVAVNAGGGAISITGVGGGGTTAANDNLGISIAGATPSLVTSGAGTITMTGTGGPSTGTGNDGISLAGTMTATLAGTITLNGTAGASTSANASGVVVNAGTISAANGLISVTGANPSSGTGGGNSGVSIYGGTVKTIGTGGVTVVGTGGGAGAGTAMDGNYGVFWAVADAIQSTGTGVNAGSISITGTGGGNVGGAGSSAQNIGVFIEGALPAAGGNISITGTGGNSTGADNFGIAQYGGAISSTGTGSITMNGTGGGSSNTEEGYYGTAGVSTTTGNIAITGTASAGGTVANNFGILLDAATIATGGIGTITLIGTATGTGFGGSTDGVFVSDGATVKATNGLISVTGTNNSTGANGSNSGVYVSGTNSTIQSSGTGGVTVHGTAGGTGNGGGSYGVNWDVANGIQSTGAGAISITGTGGGTPGSGTHNDGVDIAGALSGNGGPISITGTAGDSTGGGNYGITQISAITNAGPAAITLSGNGVQGNGMSLSSIAAGSGTLTLNSTGSVISSGALTAAALELTGAGGQFTLTNTGNAVTSLAANTGSVSYAQTGALSIGTAGATTGITDGGTALVNVTGNLTLASGAGVSAHGTGDALVLVDSNLFTNNDGASALSVSGSGRWLVWSSVPGSSTLEGLAYGFEQYHATYGSTATADATHDGVLYSSVEQLTAGLTGTVSKTYNATTTATLAPANYTVSGAINGDTVVLNDPTAGTYDTKDVGTGKTVTATGIAIESASNGAVAVYGYTLGSTSASGAVGSITPATLAAGLTGTVSKVYNTTTAATLAAGNYTLTGVYPGDSVGLNDPAAGTYDTIHAGTGKTVTVTGLALTGSDANDYQLASSVSAAVGIITPASVTAGLTGSVSKTYDSTNVATLVTGNYTLSGVYGSDSVGLNDPSGGTYATSHVGTGKTVTVSGLALTGLYASDYALGSTSASGAIGIITARGITVTADGATRIYGAANPAFTDQVTTGSLVGGDTLSGAPTSTATTSSGVGSYAITQGSVTASSDYTMTFINGDFSVSPRPITVTANPNSRVYGNANPVFTDAVTSGTLVNGDMLTGSAASAANATSNVGSYAIGQGSVSAGGNYALSFVDGDLLVTQRPITVAAGNASRLYGNANPVFGYQVTAGNLVNGDAVSGYASTPATAASNIGSYAITQGTVSAGGNYALSFSDGTLAISARPVTVTASGATRIYGNPDPVFGYVTSSLGAGAALSGSLARSAGQNVGSYAINQGSLTDAANLNYLISFVPNALSITPRPLTITANGAVKDAGNSNPPLSASAVGFALGDGWSQLAGSLSLATSAVTSSPSGFYPITVSGQSSRNYTITYVNGVLVVLMPTASDAADAAITAALNGDCCAPLAPANDAVADVVADAFVDAVADADVRDNVVAHFNSRLAASARPSTPLRMIGAGMRLPSNIAVDNDGRTP